MNTVTILFSDLSALEGELENDTLRENVQILNSLDAHYNQVWDEILKHQPVGEEAAELMFLMLLDKLAERAARGECVLQVREKLIDIYQTLPRTKSRSCHGRQHGLVVVDQD